MPDTPREVPQIYTDQVGMALGPYGCALTFGLTHPASLSAEEPALPVASVRMSLEHAKALAYIIHRQITMYQTNFGVRVDLPDKALESLNISRDEWQRFWKEP
jgi:hypothetical protein